MEKFIADLNSRGIDFTVLSDPFADTEWIILLELVYAPPVVTPTGDRLDGSLPVNY